MTPSGKKNTPVYRQIEHELKRYIAENHLKKHELLPSEWQLAALHGVSVGTVRKALDNLVMEKVIYRRHGQGTFVAPRIRKGKILLVPNQDSVSLGVHDDYFTFFLGALTEANTGDSSCEPLIVELEDFLANLDDLPMIYPEIAGVIFFRGFNNYELACEALRRQALPCLYYGPNLHEGKDDDIPAVYHDETAIAALLADYLVSQGIRRVSGIGNGQLIGRCRLDLFAAAAAKRGLEFREAPPDIFDDHRRLRLLAAEDEVFLCAVDRVAIRLIQVLERQLHLRVPDDIRVIGVDNVPAGQELQPGLTTVDLCSYDNGRLCLRRFSEAIAAGETEPFKINGKVGLIRRESC